MAAPCLCGSSSCPLSAPPGSTSIWGDSSRAFSRDPLAFLEAQALSLGSRVFVTRLALKQTMVIADHALLTTFLREHMEDFYNGLTSHLSDLFGHNIMFAAPAEAAELRGVLQPLFQREGGGERGEVLARILGGWRDGLDTARTVNEPYKRGSHENSNNEDVTLVESKKEASQVELKSNQSDENDDENTEMRR